MLGSAVEPVVMNRMIGAGAALALVLVTAASESRGAAAADAGADGSLARPISASAPALPVGPGGQDWQVGQSWQVGQVGGSRWLWPVAEHSVLRQFEAPEQRWSAGHRGVDLPAPPGSEVVAPDDGVVHFAGIVVDRPVLSIRHAGGLLSSLEPVSTSLTAGERVSRGKPVGLVEAGGHCEPGCLHFGVRLGGEYVSPLMLLGGLPRSVLLPTRASP